MAYVSVYIMAGDVKEARAIARALVKERLVACANIIQDIESFYRWRGKLRHHGEAAIIGKAISASKRKIVQRVRELHSDNVPCVVFWPIAGGNRDYLEWVGKETRS